MSSWGGPFPGRLQMVNGRALTTENNIASAQNMLSSMLGPPPIGKALSAADMKREDLQPYHILDQYVGSGQSLTLPAQYITASVLNSKAVAVALQYIAPIVQTNQMIFKVMFEESNIIPFGPVAPGGIPMTQTHRKEAVTIQMSLKKLKAQWHIRVGQNALFGAETLRREMDQLAAAAATTLALEVHYAIIEIPWENRVLEVQQGSKMRTVNHSKLLQMESECFAVAALDTGTFLDHITRKRDTVSGLNTVIMPPGAESAIKGFEGSSKPLDLMRFEKDQETQQVVTRIYQGEAKSLKTINLGGNDVNIVELSTLHSNRDTVLHRPLESVVTTASIFLQPPVKPSSRIFTGESASMANDLQIYSMTAGSGSMEVLSHVEGIANSFLYDPNGNVSRAYRDYVDNHLDKDLQLHARHNDNVPDNDHYEPREVQGNTLKQMAFREHWGFAQYYTRGDGRLGTKVPDTIGDFNERHLPTGYVIRAARCVVGKAIHDLGDVAMVAALRINSLQADVKAFFAKMDSVHVTEDYVKALLAANPKKDVAVDKTRLSHDPTRTKLTKIWAANTYGSFDLPKNAGFVYPPGFSSYPGLRTLAAESGSIGSEYAVVGEEASGLVRRIDALEKIIKRYVGKSRVVTADATPVQYNVADGRSYLTELLAYGGSPPPAATHKSGSTIYLTPITFSQNFEGSSFGKSNQVANGNLGDSIKRVQAFRLSKRTQRSPSGRSTARGGSGRHSNAMDIDVEMTLGNRTQHDSSYDEHGRERHGNAWNAPRGRMEQIEDAEVATITRIIAFAILWHPNTMDIHTRLAKSGCSLMRINFWRVREQTRMASVIVMKAASIQSALGQTQVLLGTESTTGWREVVASIAHAIIPTNRRGIDILPYVLPRGLIGGHTADLMTSPNDLFSTNINGPSILCVPVPISETRYEMPMNLLNHETYEVQGDRQSMHFRKHSSAGWVNYLLGSETVSSITGKVRGRMDFWNPANIALTAHRGVVSQWNAPKQKFNHPIPGTGPKGDVRMHSYGAEKTWNGQNTSFPPVDRKRPIY